MILNILTWNVRGVLHCTNEIDRCIADDIDIIALQEEWEADTIKTQSEYLCAAVIRSKSADDIFIICCRLPSTNVLHVNALDELLCEYDILCEKGTVIIVGDLNCDVTKLSKSSRDKLLLNALSHRYLVNSLTESRAIGPKYSYRSKDNMHTTLIDYIIIPTYLRNSFSSCSVLACCTYDVSDHYPCTISLNCSIGNVTDVHTEIKLKWQRASELDCYRYTNQVEQYLSQLLLNDEITPEGVEAQNTHITNSLLKAGYECIPKSEFRPYLKPYWKSNNLNDNHYKMRQCRKQWVSESRPRDSSSNSYCEYKDAKREFRRLHRKAKRKAKKDILDELQKSSEIDVNTFYKTVRKQRRRKTTVNSLDYDGKTETTAAGIAMLWGKYYADLAQPFMSNEFDCESSQCRC